MSPWTITSARVDERQEALELLLQHHEPEQRRTRLANVLSLLSNGDIAGEGLMVARRDVLGAAVLCIPLKGASGLFWVPQVRPEFAPTTIAAELVDEALGWLARRGAKLAQAFVTPAELPLTEPLLACGFEHVTSLLYMSHDLSLGTDDLVQLAQTVPHAPFPRLVIETYQEANRILFHETLLRTYDGTLDCPELNGRRSLEEILEGHRHQGKWRPDLWWLALAGDRPVGVVLLTELFGGEGWDLSYLGVVPEARGQGVGRALTARVLREAHRAHVPQLILAVDTRNRPACQLYAKMGFCEEETREILLFFFTDLAGDSA